MGLRVWDQLTDKFDHDQLAQNWQRVGAHDHSSGKGVQIPTGGLANQAVTGPKIADATIGSDKLSPEALSTIATATGLPPGLIAPFAGVVIPTGWLLCNGATVSRTTYAALWDAFRNGGTTSPYGNGNGTSTFHLPNLLGGVPLGTGSSGTAGSTSHFLGQRAGEEQHTLTTTEMPTHSHDIQGAGSLSVPSGAAAGYASNQSLSGSYTAYTGGGLPHNNLPPYTAVNYIIKF